MFAFEKGLGRFGSLVVCAGLSSSSMGQDACVRFDGQALGLFGSNGAIADMNGDGLLDVLWVYSGDLCVSLSAGNRAFAPPVMYSAPTGLEPVVGDFDGDGSLDVAIPSDNGGSFAMRIRFNNGDGSLGSSLGFGSPRIDRLGVADLNNDGIDDIVASGPDAAFSVYLGRVDRALVMDSEVGLLSGATEFAFADFDGDGSVDVAASTRSNRRVQVAFNDGAGVFGSVVELVAGDFGPSIAAGDFTGDGAPDIMASEPDDNRMQLFTNNGSGAFARTNLSIPAFEGLAAADVVGDSSLDLVGIRNSSILEVHEGDGLGGFTLDQSILAPDGAGRAVVGDVTGDSLPDVMVPQGGGTMYFGTDSGFGAPLQEGVYRWGETADFDGDGVPDLVATRGFELQVRMGNGDGTFGAADVLDIGGMTVQRCGVGDFNADGWPDVVSLTLSPEAIAHLNNGDGTFGDPVFIDLVAEGFSFEVGDMNGDGFDDLVTSAWLGEGSVMIALSDGAGGFTSAPAAELGESLWDVAIGDLTGDGVNDVAVTSPSLDAWAYFVNDGTGALGVPVVVPNADSASNWVIDIADLDGVAPDDVVVGMRRSDQQGSTRNVVLYNDSGEFTEFVLPFSAEANAVECADVDGDGLVDIGLVADGQCLVYMNTGGGVLEERQVFWPGLNGRDMLHMSDLNNDGHLDLVVGSMNFGGLTFMVSKPGCSDGCVADFNSDGMVDTLDVLEFLNAWANLDGSADMNGDGSVDTLDVLEFLNLWNAGC